MSEKLNRRAFLVAAGGLLAGCKAQEIPEPTPSPTEPGLTPTDGSPPERTSTPYSTEEYISLATQWMLTATPLPSLTPIPFQTETADSKKA